MIFLLERLKNLCLTKLRKKKTSILEFDQWKWLKLYIEFSTQKKKEAEKDYLKWSSRPSYATEKLWDNNLVAIYKVRCLDA